VVLSKLEKLSLSKFKNIQDSNNNLFLVKVSYSPLNPSDFGFIGGVYGKKPYQLYPKSLGFEGSGYIEKASENFKALEGKKVSFCCNHEDEKYFITVKLH
jgi:NADPH:quinone reductase-like Zn-dependent oxidoreductase